MNARALKTLLVDSASGVRRPKLLEIRDHNHAPSAVGQL